MRLLLLLLLGLFFYLCRCRPTPGLSELAWCVAPPPPVVEPPVLPPPPEPEPEPEPEEPDPFAELGEELEEARENGALLDAELDALDARLRKRIAECPVPKSPEPKPKPAPEPEPKPEPKPKPPPPPSACVTTGGEVQPLDIYFLQDLTGSFQDDLPNTRRFVASLAKKIRAGELGSDVRVGVGSFMDKPVGPFGTPRHYVFKNHLSLTKDVGRMTSQVSGFSTRQGGDIPESQYEALIEMLGMRKKIGFRSEARSFVALATDAPSHVAGDWRALPFGTSLPFPLGGAPRPEDGRPDGDPRNEDYPSVGQVMRALNAADVTPIFLVADRAFLGGYRGFVSRLGRGVALPIARDSSDLLQALLSGVKEACRQKP